MQSLSVVKVSSVRKKLTVRREFLVDFTADQKRFGFLNIDSVSLLL